MTDSLFNNSSGLDNRFTDFISFCSLYDLETSLVDSQRVCVYRGLWYKAIRQRQAYDSRNEARATKQEEIPMEPSGFLEWELAGLCGQRGHIL